MFYNTPFLEKTRNAPLTIRCSTVSLTHLFGLLHNFVIQLCFGEEQLYRKSVVTTTESYQFPKHGPQISKNIIRELLEMQILRPYPRNVESEILEVGPSNLCFHKSFM